ncbi:MAG: D-alanyl-D-alanine carboxypeptidase family protein [Xanthomonadales bacterium]|nr:D-alanyl-D-alanine carboxypeptidase family protein [Xanthomonadales bacterium]
MTNITTPRLTIKPTHPNCWAIYDQLDNQLVGKLFFRNQWFNIILKPQSLHLGVATEASYHLLKALNSPKYKAKTDVPHAQQFLLDLGFVDQGEFYAATAQSLKYPDLGELLIQQFGIDNYQLTQPQHNTAVQLEDVGKDCFDRPAKLHPKAKQAWQSMKNAATGAGIDLQLVSAYRSLKYQANLLQNKINDGQMLEDILRINAAPGHSEHHTGCAIDITTEDFMPLETEFEESPAFIWLVNHAQQFGFHLSYPKDNPQGFIYEPWHWCYQQ